MAPRTTFADLETGLRPFSLFDAMFADAGKLGIIPCSASGANTIALTQLTDAKAPAFTAYANHLLFSFRAAAASTSTVTVNVDTVGAKNLYHPNGTTQVGSGDIASGAFCIIGYDSTLNSSAGGFYLLVGSSQPAALTVEDANFSVVDDGDNTKAFKFSVSGITTATTRTWTVPDASSTFVGTDTTQTLTNKVLTSATITTGLTPTASDGAALGSGTLMFSDLFLASGGVLNFNNGNVTLTHSANALAFGGASSGYSFSHLVTPSANDGAALGSTSLQWSDLFLAAGGVINWANGGITVTENSDTLLFAGGSGYRYDAAVAPSSSDGAALGSGSLMWSDLFLASGGVINFNNGDVTATHAANALTFAGATSGYTFSDGPLIGKGTATNDSAAAGNIGEIIESEILTASAVSLTTATAANITSISLTAGDWDVWGNVAFNAANTTTIAQLAACISTTSATFPTPPGKGAYTQLSLTFTAGTASDPENVLQAGQRRISVASTTTVYLVGFAVFATSTMAAYGYLGARRVR